MGHFIVSARKYRPSAFDSVAGQPTVTNTLRNAVISDKLAHAYLFCGPRGVGKTTCARILAKTINCMNRSETGDPCGKCESCLAFNDSRSFNIHELDAASNNSVEDIRSLTEKVRILPQVGKYSIYIIDEAHMLSQSAFNAFLKTLEEPPPHAIFILATTEKQKILPTIMSRCQIFDFNRIRVEDIILHLQKIADAEQIKYEREALQVIAVKADGAMRDALSIFDQVAGFSGNNITYKDVLENLNVLDNEYYFRITDSFLEHSVAQSLLIFNEILLKGFDGLNFINGLSSHFRDLLVSQDKQTLTLLETGDFMKEKYLSQAGKCSPEFLFRALEICNQCEIQYKSSKNQRLHVELALIRVCNIVPEKKNLNSEALLDVPEVSQLKKDKKPSSAETGKTAAKYAVEENDKGENASASLVVEPSEPMKTPVRPSSARNNAEGQLPVNGRIADTPSIKDALKNMSNRGNGAPVAEDKHIAEKDVILSVKPVSEEFLKKCWEAYAENIHEERPRMSAALKSSSPSVTGDAKVVFDLSNNAQLEDFNRTTRDDMQRFLRREMQNSAIVLEGVVAETESTEKEKLYTSEEKFEYLNKKNPLLSKFKEKLNLELE